MVFALMVPGNNCSMMHCLYGNVYTVVYLSFGCSGIYCCLLRFLLFPLAEAIPKKVDVRPHQNRVFDKFLHAIHETISVATGHESLISWLAFIRKLSICFGDRGLIWDSKHAHPPTQETQRVHGIERLGSAAHLGNGQRSALGGTDTSCSQRDPVDLILEHSGLDCDRKARVSKCCTKCQVSLERSLTRLPCCSGETQTCPSLHKLSSRSSRTLG